MTNWVVYLFGGGSAFFLGVGLVLAGLAGITFPRRWLKRLATLSVLSGLVFVALAAVPLPSWFYLAAAVITFLWLAAERTSRAWLQARRNWLRAAVLVVWAAGAAAELPYHLTPTVPAADRPTLYVIGDSVAAGTVDRHMETWPRLLARTRSVEVTDISRVGATAASALRQADRLPAEGGLVLLEIGGNDLFGTTPAGEFERDLDRLLGRVCVPGRTVLMFELPLPPLGNEYGRAQRRLASRYRVLLIPRRIFVAVLTGAGATLDSVHLDQAGHERMAETVWGLIRSAYEE